MTSNFFPLLCANSSNWVILSLLGGASLPGSSLMYVSNISLNFSITQTYSI